MNWQKFRLYFIFYLIGISTSLHAQLKGKPFITNFSSKNYGYHNQNWCVIQDNRGLLFFGNNTGLMYFNGNNWDLVEDSRILYVRSLAKNALGRVFCGSVSEFGYIETDKVGKLTYVSMSEKFTKQIGEFSEVWSTFVAGKYTYFCTPEGVFKFEDLKLKNVYRPSKEGNTFHKFFQLGSTIVLREKNEGLFYESETGLKRIEGSEIFADIKVDFILPYANESFLIGTRTDGLFVATDLLTKASIKKLSIKSSEQLEGKDVYCGIRLHDGTYAIGTLLDGIYFLGKDLEIENHLDNKKGMNDNKVTFLYEDVNNILWATLDKGISMIEYFFPFEKFDDSYSLEGNINSCLQHNNNLYVSSTKGLYYINITTGSKFEMLSRDECYNFIKLNNSSTILCGTKKGVLVISENRIIGTLPGTENVEYSSFLQLEDNPNALIIGGVNDILVLENQDGQLKIKHRFDNNIGKIRSLIYSEVDHTVLWGLEEKGIYKINLDSIEVEPRQVNCETGDKASSFYLFKLDKKILSAVSNGFVEYVPSSNKFSKSNILEYPFKSQNCADAYIAKLDHDKWLWLQFVHNNKMTTAYASTKTQYTYIERYFGLLNKTQVNDFHSNEKYTWLATNDGLLRHNKSKVDLPPEQFTAIITKVKHRDSILFHGNFYKVVNGYRYLANKQPLETILTLPYTNNNISIDYSSNTFTNFDELQFQTYLENYEEGFGEWTKDHKKSYTNLSGGKYVFHVRSKDSNENVSEETTYTFFVEFPWYQTSWGIALLVVLSISFIGSVTFQYTRIKTKRIEAEKKVLEDKVTERTLELELSNQEIISQKNNLEVKNKEIDHKNKEITQSIEYALHIQQSILPDTAAIYKVLTDSFVLYKPKDIVSGDFFAFTTISQAGQQDEIIIAAADCTGHGVPGALMSMLGSNILYQIVNEKKQTTPSDILYHLNVGVNESLKQNINEGNDGMDIVLCNIKYTNDLDSAEVQYAGANRPLYIVRDGILEEIKATKMPIGGVQFQERIFTNHQMTLKKGDILFLTTDGYADQFGGELGKKLTTKKFKEFIVTLQDKPMKEQGKRVESFFDSWRGDNEQIDDVCIIGIRI